jgi:hypothetical protein
VTCHHREPPRLARALLLRKLGEREIWSLAYVWDQHVMHDLRQAPGLLTNRTAVVLKFVYGLSMASMTVQFP